MNLAIKLNSNPNPEPCPLCGQETNPNIGAELTLAENELVVCRDCGLTHAPLLVSLLTLGFLATDYSLCERDYGDLWQASREASPRESLNWNQHLEADAA
jgi:hypothetical protein